MIEKKPLSLQPGESTTIHIPLEALANMTFSLQRERPDTLSLHISLSLTAPRATAESAEESHEHVHIRVALALRQLFSTVLDIPIEDVTETTNFFDMGGDSLAAIALSLAVMDQLGVSLDAAVIFDHPTLSELAHVIAMCQQAHASEKEGGAL